jgi:type IX secretion system PorP/SprF family membrane protein
LKAVNKYLVYLVASGLLVVLGSSYDLKGQDIHFSQFYHSPLTLNPALSGQFEGKYRLVGNYRHQWADVGPSSTKIPFITYAASYDMPVPVSVTENSSIGVGLQLFNDQAGNVGLNNKSAFLSASFGYTLDKERSHRVTFGLQGGYVNKSIDLNELTFGNQFQDGALNPNASSGEKNIAESFSYFDLRAGGMWSMQIYEKLQVNAGLSVFHLNQPKENFIDGQGTGNRLNMRSAIHGSAQYQLTERMNLLPGLLIMNQTKAQEINWGSLITYQLKREENNFQGTLFGGVWSRMSAFNQIVDAVVPTIGIQRKAVKVGLSYDVNVSSLRQASAYRGGPEIAIIYIPQPYEPEITHRQIPCIRL